VGIAVVFDPLGIRTAVPRKPVDLFLGQ